MNTILIVDDQPENRYVLQAMLEGNGFEVVSAKDGREALGLARLAPPDLIISDILMPGMDGFALCREWRRDPALRRIPFVFYTATYKDPKDERLALDLGADLFLVKPLEPDVLADRIRRVLDERDTGRISAPEVPPGSETAVLQEYNQALVRKLEDKLVELDAALRKRAELERIVSFSPATVWLWRNAAAWPVEFVSDNVTELGYDAEDFRSGRLVFSAIIHPDDLARVRDEVARYSLENGRDSFAQEYRLLKADGQVRHVDGRTWIQRGGTGEITHYHGILVDITERERAETALRESAERFRDLFQDAPIAYHEIDRDGILRRVNRAECELLGYEQDKMMGRPIWDFVAPELRERVEEAIRRKISRDSALGTIERDYMRCDGTRLTVEIHEKLILDERGNVTGIRSALLDISERRRAEEALKQSEERYRAIADSAVDAIVTANDAGIVVGWNHGAERVFGYAGRELLGQPVTILMPDRYHAGHAAGFKRLLESGEPRVIGKTVELEGKRKDGSEFPLELSLAQWRTTAGWFFTGIARDITERRRAEEALEAGERKYRDLFENAKDLIFTLDLEGRTTSANRACREALGYATEELLQVNVAQIVAPEHVESERASLKQMLDDNLTPAPREVELVAKNGQRIPVEVGLRLIHHAGAPIGVQGIARDITERKKLEDQLRQAQKMEAVGRLAGGVAHDFNNLLMVIGGYSDLLMEQGEDPEKRSKAVQELHKATRRAAELTRQLLAFSRKQVLQPQVLDLNSVVTGTERMLRRVIGEDIDLVVRPAPDLWNVKADPGQIEQVVLNLAVNARDAMPDGGQLLIETANVELDEAYAQCHAGVQAGSFAMLAVTDTGGGMDRETLAHIFEPFFTTKEKGKGTGLGLATVYGIVKQSGGFVWVYSEPGKGSAFKIYLTRVSERPGIRGDQAPLTVPVRGSETILLVEDEDKVRELIHGALAKQGYRVLVARDGNEALQIAADHAGEIELLITDMVMPRMSGRQLASRTGELRPTTKVLYISGYTDNAIVDQGALDSGVAFLQKPFAGSVLCRKVRQVLQARQAGDKARPD